jgi:membrane protease YdiL (CAAX protease family)
MTRRGILMLSAITTAGLTLAAIAITANWGHPDGTPFTRGMAAWRQVGIGLGIGGALAMAMSLVEIRVALFDEMRRIVRDVFQTVRPARIDLLLVSLGAGWGEELLFRGAIQPHLGIWPAAVVFALAHFLLTRLTWGRLAYTAALVLAGAGLGYLAEWAGLLAAMTAHAAYDFVALLWAEWDFRREERASIN